MGSRHNPCSDKHYQYLVEKFTADKIESRYAFVYDFLSDYIIQNEYQEKLIISVDILDHVIVDYFVDIDRLKGFQEIERVNQIKIFSYLSFWILRHKPLQVICEKNASELSFVNEKMVTAFLRSYLFASPDSIPILSDNQVTIDIFIKSMEYYFEYRDYSAKSIEIMLLAFEAGRGYQYSVDYQK